jgi:uncharacterized protein
VCDEQRRLLEAHGIPGELSLTGGSSIEGLLTKGDIDLHLRVTEGEFLDALDALPRLLAPVRREIWTPSFAVCEHDGEPPVGVAVTVIDSEHDRRFVVSWRQMRTDEAARQAYNALKLAGGDVEEAKSRFFDSLVDRAAEDSSQTSPRLRADERQPAEAAGTGKTTPVSSSETLHSRCWAALS